MQSPAPGARAPWTPYEHAKTNGTSVFALLASLSGFVCFVGIGGALGILLGLIARSEIARSDGRETGRGLANGAIAVGILNLALSVIGLAVGVTYLARPSTARALTAPTMAAPTWTPPSTHPLKPATRPKSAGRVSRAESTEVTAIGGVTVADIAGDFAAELDKQHHAADAAGETLVLWVVVRDCKPCDGVAAALTNPLSQKALSKVRFVRVDRDEFQVELERLGVPTEKIPGFALLDARDHVRDFIHGGEWDADIAANIAPVLGKFVHGGYRQRRHPWPGGVREDETPI
ncbi:MAG TPA: DUF4190 domain-containing protein [Polyangiaceae bacterium]|jgi:hypothetical protein|nr:DUF4190 domain-containing protein [Polyangiaceae bacterium]